LKNSRKFFKTPKQAGNHLSKSVKSFSLVDPVTLENGTAEGLGMDDTAVLSMRLKIFWLKMGQLGQ
jgi:hypothetical protein